MATACFYFGGLALSFQGQAQIITCRMLSEMDLISCIHLSIITLCSFMTSLLIIHLQRATCMFNQVKAM